MKIKNKNTGKLIMSIKKTSDGIYNLSGVDLTDADLHRADLIGADLTVANLIGADLTDTNLRKADLTGIIK